MGVLKVMSLNCHGLNVGTLNYLSRVAAGVDVMLLQETWLSNCTSYKLQTISPDFTWHHSSSMEDKIHNNFLSGRPFGGTAILIRKDLAISCRRVITDNPRITSVCLSSTGNADVVISSVYMPWCDRSADHIIEYEATVGYMQSIVDRHAGCSFIFGGDLNVCKNSNNTLCLKKNDNDVLRYNFNAHQPILIIFGRDIAE